MTYNPNGSGIPQITRATSDDQLNSSGMLLSKGTPVRVTGAGLMTIDVSSEEQVQAIAGITKVNIGIGVSGEVIGSGTIEDISTTASVGDPVFLSKTGGITNIKPSVGVGGFAAGDWIVRLGVISRNNANPLLKDLIVNISLVGPL